MAKTAAKALSEVSLVVEGPIAAELHATIRADAEWVCQNIDNRTRIDADTARETLTRVSRAQGAKVPVRTYALAGGMIGEYDSAPGNVALAFRAAKLFNLANKHGHAGVAEAVVTAYTTETDRKLGGKNGTLAGIAEKLRGLGVGVRKVQARKVRSVKAKCYGYVSKLWESAVKAVQGSAKIGQEILPRFNAAEMLRALVNGETAENVERLFTILPDDAAPAPAPPADDVLDKVKQDMADREARTLAAVMEAAAPVIAEIVEPKPKARRKAA